MEKKKYKIESPRIFLEQEERNTIKELVTDLIKRTELKLGDYCETGTWRVEVWCIEKEKIHLTITKMIGTIIIKPVEELKKQ